MSYSNVLGQLSIPYEWSVEIVTGWLIESGLHEYVSKFQANKIDGKILLADEFISRQLKSLISDTRNRYKFLLALSQLKSRMAINSTDQINFDENTIVEADTNSGTRSVSMAQTTMPLSSHNYTLQINRGDTLQKIANDRNISLDELLAANPTLSATERLKQDQIIYLPNIQHLIKTKIGTSSQNGSMIIPDTFDERTLNAYKAALHSFFKEADENRSGYLDIAEFKSFLTDLNIRTLNDSEIVDIYLDMNKRAEGELCFNDLFKYFHSIVVIESELSPAKVRLFEAMLTADHLNQCKLGGITQFLNKTWAKFSQYKRYGHSGQLVMSASENIAVVKEGTHSLLDLICWPDRLTDTIEPRHAVIKGFQWRSKSECGPNATVGELIFPGTFNRNLPTEIATSQTLKYYGCCFANETQLKVSLLQTHEIEDFKYHDGYFEDFVQSNLPGLERHEFSHLDCPHAHHTQSGHFILGKIVNDDELHLTAFQIPSKYTLYIPPNTIHSNDYLRGTWRTMLAAADIDRVVLKRRRADGRLEHFAFDFPPN